MTTDQNAPLRIAIVDDHPVTRFALRGLIASEPGWEVACECADPDAMFAAIPGAQPDIVVVDLEYGAQTGFDLLSRIKHTYPNLLTLVYSANSEREYADRCFQSGATGYICKEEPVAQVREAIACVVKGCPYVSAGLVEWVAEQCADDEVDAA